MIDLIVLIIAFSIYFPLSNCFNNGRLITKEVLIGHDGVMVLYNYKIKVSANGQKFWKLQTLDHD
jgi:hypothetical protein